MKTWPIRISAEKKKASADIGAAKRALHEEFERMAGREQAQRADFEARASSSLGIDELGEDELGWAETSESVGWRNFGNMLLVFGCIGSDFCKKICVLQHFSKSTRFSS